MTTNLAGNQMSMSMWLRVSVCRYYQSLLYVTEACSQQSHRPKIDDIVFVSFSFITYWNWQICINETHLMIWDFCHGHLNAWNRCVDDKEKCLGVIWKQHIPIFIVEPIRVGQRICTACIQFDFFFFMLD